MEVLIMKNESKRNMLIANISDLSGNLKLIDTKISILLAASGVLFNILVSCRSNILKAYNNYLNTNRIYMWIFIILITFFLISFSAFIYFGLSTIFSRKGKSRRSSTWFFDTKTLSETEFRDKINKYDDENIIQCLISEVYKLNEINNKKISQSRKAIITFMFYVGFFMGVLLLTGIYYI